MKFEDLSNYKFGKLKVIKRVDDYVSPKGYHQVQWECLCDCGNTPDHEQGMTPEATDFCPYCGAFMRGDKT